MTVAELLAAITAERARADALERLRVHCEHCGGDYAETGMEVGCSCRLLARIERAEQERDTANDGAAFFRQKSVDATILRDAARADHDREATARQAAESQAFALREWQVDVTAALGREGGAHYVDVPSHIRALRSERDQEAARRQEVERNATAWERRADATDAALTELRATNSRLNRRAQRVEAAANVAAERWGLRSENAGRSYVYQTGLATVSRLRELEEQIQATDADLATLRAVVREWQQAEASYHADAQARGGYATTTVFERLRAARAAVLTCQVAADDAAVVWVARS